MNENDRQKRTSSRRQTAFEIRQIKKNYLLFSLYFCNLNVSLFAFSAVLIWNLIFQQIPGTFFFIAELSNDGWKNMLHCSFRPFVVLCANGNEPRMKKKQEEEKFFRTNFKNSSIVWKVFAAKTVEKDNWKLCGWLTVFPNWWNMKF